MSPFGPDSLSWCLGRSPVLLVAPHGGRRGAVRLAGERTRINDLGTAGLARDLAERLAGSFLVNERIDRNRIDLNRIQEVWQKAPWFLDRLEELIASIVGTHGRVAVFFVHGWNVVQPKCDVGIGRPLLRAADAGGFSDVTVSARFALERLEAFRAVAARRGIDAVYGERYPASHPNNLLQLFRRDGNGGCSGRLRSLVEAGQVDAVQLELGIPLRWRGRRRGEFIDALVEAFGADAPARPVASNAPGGPGRSFFLQAHDARTGVGVITGLTSGRRRTGRLLLLPGGPGAILFVGEEVGGPSGSVGGLRFEPFDGGFRVVFTGPAAAVADGSLWIRTEDALAASRIAEVSLRLEYRSGRNDRYGVVEGELAMDGDRRPFRAFGFSDPRFSRAASHSGVGRTVFTASFGEDRAFGGDFDGGAGSMISLVDGVDRADGRRTGRIRMTGDGHCPGPFRVEVAGGEALAATPVSRMVLLRSLDGGRPVRVTFGTARFSSSRDREGVGFYEHVRPVDPAELL